MRVPALLLSATLCLLACGRTEPLRYQPDGSVDDFDAGEDAGKVGCRNGVITLIPAVPKVMFVLDRSGSMSSGFGSTTRWRAVRNALNDVLPPVNDTMSVGAVIFPSGNGNSCDVPSSPNLAPAPMNVQPLTTLLSQFSPGGRTPTAMAIKAAAASLLSARTATRARAMVLATDGAPNCNPQLDPHTCVCASGNFCNQSELCLDDVRSVTEVTQAQAEGVPTWVIGIQSTDQTDINVLNALAVAGGHPRTGSGESFYAVSSQAELESALTDIRDQVGNCVYLSASVPPDDGSILITLDGMEIPEGDAGWSWSNKDNGELVFAPPACDQILASATRALEAQVVCHVPDAGTDGGIDGGVDGGLDGG